MQAQNANKDEKKDEQKSNRQQKEEALREIIRNHISIDNYPRLSNICDDNQGEFEKIIIESLCVDYNGQRTTFLHDDRISIAILNRERSEDLISKIKQLLGEIEESMESRIRNVLAAQLLQLIANIDL